MDNNFDNIQMPQINLKEYETIECDQCGNVAFIPGMILKVIPGVVLGTGAKSKMVPDNILICSKCGAIFKKDREYYDLTDDGKVKKEDKKEETNTNLILN